MSSRDVKIACPRPQLPDRIQHGSPAFSWQRTTPVTVGWFAGHTWKNNDKWYTWLPKLLWNFYSMYTFHKCDRGLHNTSWWVVCGPQAAVWGPMVYRITQMSCFRASVTDSYTIWHLSCFRPTVTGTYTVLHCSVLSVEWQAACSVLLLSCPYKVSKCCPVRIPFTGLYTGWNCYPVLGLVSNRPNAA